MGEAMEEREDTGEGHAGGERKTGGGGDEQAEHEDRGGDGLFGAGDGHAAMAEDGAEGHDTDEGGGNEPAGASAELGGPEADGDHGKKVIPTVQRMGETAAEIPAEAVVAVVTGMGAGDGGQGGQENEAFEKRAQGFRGHGFDGFRRSSWRASFPLRI